jgi:hypothetical protein
MQRLYVLVTVVFLVGAPVRLGWLLYHNLQHPETWEQDWRDDPRVYMTVLIVGCGIPGLMMWRDARKFMRTKERQARLGAILDVVRQKQAEGQWEEAERWLHLYDDVKGGWCERRRQWTEGGRPC